MNCVAPKTAWKKAYSIAVPNDNAVSPAPPGADKEVRHDSDPMESFP
jgi:hypothetical protein